MFPALSLPMEAERGRNKERLEASLAGLCELELLRRRQEGRVLSALSLGDPNPHPGPEDPGEDPGVGLHTSSPWCVSLCLEQQIAELKVNTPLTSGDPIHEDHSPGNSLVPKQSGSIETKNQPVNSCAPSIFKELKEPNTGGTWLSDPLTPDGKSGNVNIKQQNHQPVQKVETYILGLIQRRALSTRPAKPRTSLPSVFRQSSLCRKDEQLLIKPQGTTPSLSEGIAQQAYLNNDQEHYTMKGVKKDAPNPYHHHLEPNVQHQLGLYSTLQQPAISQATSSCSVLQSHQDSDPSDPDSSQYFHNYSSSPPAVTMPHQPSSRDEQLVNAEYIPAQPCRASTRAFAHRHTNPCKGRGMTKLNRSTYSQERGHQQQQQPTVSHIQPSRSRGGPKKCRSNEDRSGRKAVKKACRSQSEYSLQRAPERKYNTVERDGGGSGSGGRGSRSSQSKSKKHKQGCGSYRRWQSSLELSQDETDLPLVQATTQILAASSQRDHCPRRTRKSRLPNASPVHPDNHHLQSHQQHGEYHRASEDYPHPYQGDSESSLSEADSPESSSLSSDSDESGGLVWPQQLSPQTSIPVPPVQPGAPLHPKAFVKIKASHALKKKILRFRSGSLKLMTTV
ncbi:dapper homolog 3-like [Salarias fasciatus]|uniref:Dapper homolog 3-like n=1 Tax=Salarias fasciatus TaxID=181472 RepID=A0A672FIX1_SALFA|nr:dapper homolog 3-like [Salarias fasciatus]